MKRRTFLHRSALAALAPMAPRFLQDFSHTRVQGDKILVIIQLSGGNDGLNTLVPFRNDRYYQLRPQLALPKDKVLRISDEQAFNPVLTEFRRLFDDGKMAIVNSVGYDNPVRSHFRAMDIWQSGSSAAENLTTGWLGRYLDTGCDGCTNGAHLLAMGNDLPLALKGRNRFGFAAGNVRELHEVSRSQRFMQMASARHAQEHTALGFMYKTLASTASTAEYLYQISGKVSSRSVYPGGQLAGQLKRTAELIAAGCHSKVYYLDHTGFDTHSSQLAQQTRLLTELSQGVQSFVADMTRYGRMQDVLIMVFSEFGRRLAENGSGTDHGNANQVYLIGHQIRKAGIANAAPDLVNLDEVGDVRHTVDFRQVYQEVLRKWLEVDSAAILRKEFPQISLL